MTSESSPEIEPEIEPEKEDEQHPVVTCPLCHRRLAWPGWGVWADCEHCWMQLRWISPGYKAMRPTSGRRPPPDNVATWHRVS